jgi:glycosyltransferase involved in cell wall biosynthesis
VTDFSIVVPTIGRASLRRLLAALDACTGPRPDTIVLVDDRPEPEAALPRTTGWTADRTVVVHAGGAGPAAARNAGWRGCSTTWIEFLDDDVVVGPRWLHELAADLSSINTSVDGIQGRIDVPLPTARRPTDWERGTAGLANARWITADIAYRRAALAAVGGFDERFPRAFREDADLALRVQNGGGQLVVGTRCTTHPVRPSSWRASLDQQRGNADDALMRRRHGPGWYERAGAARGTIRWHAVTTALLAVAASSALARRRAPAVLAALGWLGSVAAFAARRIAPGPHTSDEVARMVVTSALIPEAAVWHRVRGQWQHRTVDRAGVR